MSCKWLQTTPTNAYAINAQTNAKNTHKRTALLGFFRWVPKGSRTFRRPTAKKAETRKSVHFCCFLRAHSVPHTPSSAQTQLSPSKTVHKQRYCSLTLCLFPLFCCFLMCKTQSLAKCIFAHTAPITLKPPRGTGLSVPQVPRAVLSHLKHKTKKFHTSENSVSNRPKNSLIPP